MFSKTDVQDSVTSLRLQQTKVKRSPTGKIGESVHKNEFTIHKEILCVRFGQIKIT